MGRSLYLARPIRAQPECLSCHGLATAAPATLITRYGHDNGFGWQANEVIGAQIVSVPFADAVEGARRLFSGVNGRDRGGAGGAAGHASIVTLYWVIVRPYSRMTRQADEVSLGQASGVTFASERTMRSGHSAEAFERMRKSLERQ